MTPLRQPLLQASSPRPVRPGPALAVLSLVLVLGGPVSANAEARKFTNSEGQEVEADLVRVKGETVTLKLGNGRLANVPLSTLSEADQAYVGEWVTREKSRLPLNALRTEISKSESSERDRGEKPKDMREWKRRVTSTTYTVALENGTTDPIEDVELRFFTYGQLNERGGRTKLREIDKKVVKVGTIPAKETYEHATRTYEAEDLTAIPKDRDKEEVRKTEKTFGLVAEVWISGLKHSSTTFPDNVDRYVAEYQARHAEAAEEKESRETGLVERGDR